MISIVFSDGFSIQYCICCIRFCIRSSHSFTFDFTIVMIPNLLNEQPHKGITIKMDQNEQK